MGLFKRRSDDPTEIERLRAEITSMAARLDSSDEHKRVLGEQVAAVAERVEKPRATAPPMTPPVPAATRVDVDDVRAEIRRMCQRFDEIEARITSIATELTNQIDEITLDPPAGSTANNATDEVVDELRDAQTRLANEQARYQIAFRQDLADLAERLKHT